MEEKICWFCKTKMVDNICPKCWAYKVTPETANLKMKEQPWYKKDIMEDKKNGKRKNKRK